MLFIIRVHLDLVVPRKAIHKRYPFETTCVVNHDVSDEQKKFIFRTDYIKIAKVNTDSDLSILFKDVHNVSNQSGCCSSLMKPHVMSFWTSASIASITSSRKHC